MYCPTCGVAIGQGLSYCNHCGAKLSATGQDSNDRPEAKPDMLIVAMTALFIFGLVAILMLMGMMKAILGLPVERVLAFSLLPFLLMVVLESVFIKLLLGRQRGAEATRDTLRSKEQATRELDAAPARALPEHMPSVTEHTTRAFNPVLTDRTRE